MVNECLFSALLMGSEKGEHTHTCVCEFEKKESGKNQALVHLSFTNPLCASEDEEMKKKSWLREKRGAAGGGVGWTKGGGGGRS